MGEGEVAKRTNRSIPGVAGKGKAEDGERESGEGGEQKTIKRGEYETPPRGRPATKSRDLLEGTE